MPPIADEVQDTGGAAASTGPAPGIAAPAPAHAEPQPAAADDDDEAPLPRGPPRPRTEPDPGTIEPPSYIEPSFNLRELRKKLTDPAVSVKEKKAMIAGIHVKLWQASDA